MRSAFFARHVLLVCCLPLLALPPCSGAVESVPIENPVFARGADAAGVPEAWSLYAGGGKGDRLAVVDAGGGKRAVQIEHTASDKEIGISQTVPVKPGVAYRASVRARAADEAPTGAVCLQLRFLPSEEYRHLAFTPSAAWKGYSVTGLAPPGTTEARIYLYAYAEQTLKVMVTDVKLESGVPKPPSPPPAPVPPVYDRLKDLYPETPLVKEGKPTIAIVAPASGAYKVPAAQLQGAIQEMTGARVPVLSDDDPAADVPLRRHVILLGNRSTNKTVSALYDRFYTLTDLRYPGRGGYEVRTLHNPFGNGSNAILVGGSDAAGVAAGAAALVETLRAAQPRPGELALRWTLKVKLGAGITSVMLGSGQTWEDSRGYGSQGYFGWNSISKKMALYYMTGDPVYARDVVRLSFPDAQALKEIDAIDQERIENKKEPLSGPYHYNATMLVLFWDLIEESPVFTDAERLRVTNAFSKQLDHRKGEGIYAMTGPGECVRTRHEMWAALSLYCLGRYFQQGYPNPIWQHCVDAAGYEFAPLHEHAWINLENDDIFWYDTMVAPICTWLVLTGDRKPVENGVLQTILRAWEIMLSGRQPDWTTGCTALDFMNKAAYLTGDGRWAWYRERLGLDTSTFRLGQSFWPEGRLKPKPPTDLVGKWSMNWLTKPMWVWRRSGLPLEESFEFGSYRSAPDATGDYILLDGLYGINGRNPFHTFALLQLRLNGQTILQGYENGVSTSADGMVEPKVPTDAALRSHDVLGGTVVAVGEVPNAAYSSWRRTLAHRVGRYALVVDDLTFRADSDNMKVVTAWQAPGAAWLPGEQALRVQGSGPGPAPAGWVRARALDAACTAESTEANKLVRMEELGTLLLRASEPGAWIEMPFRVPRKTAGEVYVDLLSYTDRGTLRFSLDGKRAGGDFDHYAGAVTQAMAPLGRHELAAGEHRLRVEVVGKRAGEARCNVGLSGISIRPDGAAPAAANVCAEIRPADVLEAIPGGTTKLQWLGAVKEGQRRISFTLIGQGEADRGAPLACVRVAPNAGAFRISDFGFRIAGRTAAAPGAGGARPATGAAGVAVVGEYQGVEGELAVLASDHLYGHSLRRAALGSVLLAADKPVDVDWDFAAGALFVVASTETRLDVALAEGKPLRLDGKAVSGRRTPEGLRRFQLAPGRHLLRGAVPDREVLAKTHARLAELLAKGQQERASALAGAGAGMPKLAAAAIVPRMAAAVGGRVVDVTTIPSPGGRLVCAAEGKTVHVLDAAGKEVRRLEADGPIRLLRWWEEPRLLLVGCADEKVIAFDEAGQRKWAFVSEMDPAVYEAAKQYWFKSAPGHEGIHGLSTGTFLDGKSQAFVGSACTLEILDESGKLVKRLPVFWGPCNRFVLMDAPDGSRNLLIGQWPNGYDVVSILNSKTLGLASGYYGTAPGHTFVTGWTAVNRVRLLPADLNGDGKPEVVSAQNGVWNNVAVWQADGQAALANAQFGPGNIGPGANLRDMDVGDLDGDGKLEILVAHSEGLVVALNAGCERLWSRRLPSPPVVLRCATPGKAASVIVGCEDGTVVALDGKGEVAGLGKVDGRPTRMEAVPDGSGVVLATDAGAVAEFRLHPDPRTK